MLSSNPDSSIIDGKPCNVNFQAVTSSATTVAIVAYITYGYSRLNPNHEFTEGAGKELSQDEKDSLLIRKANYFRRHDYIPCKVSTCITLPRIYWDNKKRKLKEAIVTLMIH